MPSPAQSLFLLAMQVLALLARFMDPVPLRPPAAIIALQAIDGVLLAASLFYIMTADDPFDAFLGPFTRYVKLFNCAVTVLSIAWICYSRCRRPGARVHAD